MAHTHFIGIGGTGLSAIARVLLERGEEVSGSDREMSVLVEELRSAGAVIHIGHRVENVAGADIAVRSSAVPEDNVEVLAARQAGIKVERRVEYLHTLLGDQRVIGVAGSHGKTTTTSMLAWMLTALNLEPGFICGGVVENLGVNAKAGAGGWFVIEADEYDHMFLGLAPEIAVVTNVEYDHPDMFATPSEFHQAFRDFVERIKPGGTLIVCSDDPGARALLEHGVPENRQAVTYGFSEDAFYQARNLRINNKQGYQFDVFRLDDSVANVELQIPGKHNVLNALAAMCAAEVIGLDPKEAAMALSDFVGAKRRFEIVGEVDGVTVVDDYAHHPTEIRATLAAARDRYPSRTIWALWQPHTFSRTTALMADYAHAFEEADVVVLTPVYAARENEPEDYSEESVAGMIEHREVHQAHGLTEASDFLLSQVEEGDVVLVMSAGDAVEVSARLVWELGEMEAEYA